MSFNTAILDDLYAKLCRDDPTVHEITCKACGAQEKGYVPFVWIPLNCPPEERKRKEAHNARQQEALDTGNVLCSDCWLKRIFGQEDA